MRAYLGIGANLGERDATLRSAVAALSGLGDVLAISPVYETAPVGYLDQPDFLNAAVLLETALSPLELLDATQAIEREHGRVRGFANAPRPLDLDLLYLDDLVLDLPRLIVPHPRVAERAFALVPLSDIAPELRDPRTGRTVSEMAALSTQSQAVRPAGVALELPSGRAPRRPNANQRS